MSQDWDVLVGELLTRAERHRRYGGGVQGGIEPSTTTPNIFLYSDPAQATTFGYSYDGWIDDQRMFRYTGEGQRGPQVMRGRNLAVLNHKLTERALRLFVADGVVPGSNQKNHRYLGEFELDEHDPYYKLEAPDKSDEQRTVIVFRLRPVGDTQFREVDRSQAGKAAVEPESALVDIENHETRTFSNPGSPPGESERRESELVARFSQNLDSRCFLRRWKLRPTGELRSFWTDIYDDQTNELYEAKGNATRDNIRRGIGQLLDYHRHLPRSGVKLALLLPNRPSDDLVELLHSLAISCVYETAEGRFEREDPPETGPPVRRS